MAKLSRPPGPIIKLSIYMYLYSCPCAICRKTFHQAKDTREIFIMYGLDGIKQGTINSRLVYYYFYYATVLLFSTRKSTAFLI
jgi:hypothetical protein